MTGAFRPFEILLPLRFNDGRQIPDDLIGETLLELRQRFGAVSVETQPTRGLWQHQGQEYHDDLTRVYVDVQDTPENLQFFRDFKELLKSRFQQLEIWMTTYRIEIV